MTIAHPVETCRATRGTRLAPAALVGLACLASFALSWAHLAAVWRTGTFFDTDDAMRMVQVRAWLAGQDWFDLTAHRLAPPNGVAMHWSRLIDMPLGALVRVFEIFAPATEAERLARIVFPLGCQVLLILAFLRAARTLCEPEAFGPALLVITLDGFQFGQFVAGRVDHHAPQIVLLVTIVGAAGEVLRGAGRGPALAAALAIALSLGISLENLPFIGVVVVALCLAWLIRGPLLAPSVSAFGLGLAVFVPFVFVITVSPSRYGLIANDALSRPHVLLAVIGGASLATLAHLGRLRGPRRHRALGLLLAGLVTVGGVLGSCPGFPASPYAAVDPLVRTIWLEHVSEALPLGPSLSLHPALGTLIILPLLAGFLASVWACATNRAEERAAWALVVAVTLTGLIGACWEVRVASSTMPLAALGGAWAVTRAVRLHASGIWRAPALRIGLALCPFSPVLCAALPVPDETAAVSASTNMAQGCRDAEALAPLAALSPGLAVAPIDIGSHLLAHTDLSVLAAPYHRNNAGNRAVIDTFLAPPAVAEAKVKALDAAYVAVCLGETQLTELVHAAPDGLAARLQAGATPSWLQPITLAATPYRVYRVR